MQKELSYNINNYYLYTIIFFFSAYVRYIFTFFFQPTENAMFFNIIFFYSTIKEIKNNGLKSLVKKMSIKTANKIIYFIKRYWNFRTKLSPLNLKINYRVYTIFDKYFKEVELMKKERSEKKVKESKNIKAQAENITLKELNKKREQIPKNMHIHYKKKVFIEWHFKPLEEQLPKKPKLSKINKSDDFFSRYIRWVDNKKKHTTIKCILHIIMFLFSILDLFFIVLMEICNFKGIIVWKPLNIRLPYFKKILRKKYKNNK
jgi:hypothetical protein